MPASLERDVTRTQLNELARHLLARRDHILQAWRHAGAADGDEGIASSLSRAQFNDHVPAILDCLANTIEAWPDPQGTAADQNEHAKVCEHGLQRWQQGYQLRELIREWGQLQITVADELERYEAAHPDLERTVMPAARRAWTQLCTHGVAESANQYWQRHQSESSGHVADLEKALAALKALEQSRAEGWRNAAHDLRGSVTVVRGATTLLSGEGDGPVLPGPVRLEVADLLSKSVASLHDMLTDLLSLARLEAGHEQRELTTFDAARVLRDFCAASQAAATDRGLYLKTEGPEELIVVGDRNKIVRILQNLLLNALKYTSIGGVSVTWGVDTGRDTNRWTFSVQDTGPGIDENDFAPFARELHDATTAADVARDESTDRRRDIVAATTLGSESPSLGGAQQPGEGVGLSIVKRLCELLDAGLELATRAGQGTTFRVILPRSY
jgi:signal transduction histidine kinase